MSVSFRSRVVKDEDGTVVVALEGALDLIASPELKSLFAEVIDTAPKLVLDLQEVHFVDSTGVGLLLSARKRMHARGKECWIENATGQPQRLLQISGLDRVVRSAG